MSTATAQPLPAEYRESSGAQIMQITGKNVSIYFIPGGETTIEIENEQYVTVVHGIIQRGKNMFTARTRFLVPKGTLTLSCKESAAFLLDGSTSL